jgi:hypothetical protein
MIRARNAIDVHAQDFVVNDQLLLLKLKALAQEARSLQVLEIFHVFSLTVAEELSIAPTNNSPVVPTIASSPPYCARHDQPSQESSRGLWSVHLTALLVLPLTEDRDKW